MTPTEALTQLERDFKATHFVIIGVRPTILAEGKLGYETLCLTNLPPPVEDQAILVENVVKQMREHARGSKTQ